MIGLFVRDGLLYASANVITGVAGIILLPLLTRALGPADYGALDLCYLLIAVSTLVFTADIQQGLARYFHETAAGDERGSLCRTAVFIAGAGATLGCIIIVWCAEPLAQALTGTVRHADAVRLAGQNLLLGAVATALHRQLRWGLRPRAYLAVAVLGAVVTCVLTVVLLIGYEAGIVAALWGQAAGFLAAGLLAAWLVRGELVGRFALRWLRLLLVFSAPLVVSGLGMIALGQVNRSLLSWLTSLEDVGIYGAAVRIAGIVGVCLGGFLSAVTPLIYANYRKEQAAGEIARMFRLFLCVALSGWAVVGLCAPYLVTLLAGERYAAAATVIPALLAALVWASLYVFFPGLDIARWTWRIAAINVAIGIANVVLCVALIPRFGLVAAGWATLAASIMHGLCYHFAGQGAFPVAIPLRAWLLLAAVSAVSFALSLDVGGVWLRTCTPLSRGMLAFVCCAGFALVLRPRLSSPEGEGSGTTQ